MKTILTFPKTVITNYSLSLLESKHGKFLLVAQNEDTQKSFNADPVIDLEVFDSKESFFIKLDKLVSSLLNDNFLPLKEELASYVFTVDHALIPSEKRSLYSPILQNVAYISEGKTTLKDQHSLLNIISAFNNINKKYLEALNHFTKHADNYDESLCEEDQVMVILKALQKGLYREDLDLLVFILSFEQKPNFAQKLIRYSTDLFSTTNPIFTDSFENKNLNDIFWFNSIRVLDSYHHLKMDYNFFIESQKTSSFINAYQERSILIRSPRFYDYSILSDKTELFAWRSNPEIMKAHKEQFIRDHYSN